MNPVFLIKNIFPILMIGLSLGAALTHMIGGNYPKAVYWTAAAVLTTATIFM